MANIDFGIEREKSNAVLINGDQLGNKRGEELDQLVKELDLDPAGTTPYTGRKNFDDTLPNADASLERQQLMGGANVARITGGSSSVALANKRHQEVNINKISPDQAQYGKGYVSRKKKNFDDTDSGAEQTDQEDGSIAMKDARGNDIKQMPNMRFKNYKNVFTNLIKYRNVATAYPIITMMISYDSTRALTVTKAAENRSILKMYSLKDYDITFHEELGLGPNDYIKCKEIEQTDDGNQFACVYFNDGVFFLRTFGKAKRSEDEIAENELNISDLLGIDNSTMPCQDLSDPFITCCWVGMEKVYVSLFHGGSMTHYHFIWDTVTRSIIGMNDPTLGEQAVSHKMTGSSQNFPYKSFYSEEKDEIYTFYRQGQAFTIKPDDLSSYRFEQMVDKDLDQMVLLYGRALIVRSSSSVLFFKQVYDKVTESWSWIQYNEIEVRGLIYYIKGNIRIQVTTEQYIFFYLIDKETFEPELENLMYNYMKCTQCMFGKRVRYGITYKNNERGFDVYQRKYMHNLKVKVHGQNLEGSKAIEVKSMGKFLVTEVDKVQMYDSYTFEKVGDPLPIKLLPTDTREANEVIGIQVSQCEQFIAVVTGKNLVKNEQKQNQVQVMKRIPHPSGNEDEDTWQLYRRIVVKDMPLFNKVVMQYYFKKAPPGEEPHSLIFGKKDIIFELNFQMETDGNDDMRVTTVHTMASFCKLQPQYFITNSTQDIFVVSSNSDGLYINLKTGVEIDIDETFGISDIKCLIYDQDEQMFYLVANRQDGIIGFFLMRFPIDDPNKVEKLTMWKHNLDIDNVSMFISKGNNEKQKYRELIIGYKTIFINTYTVTVKDLSDLKDHGQVLYKHESFQLWESLASGLLTNFNKDYVSFTSQGMNVLALGELRNGKRELKDFEGQPKMIHSLDAYKYLKIDKENYINYQCQYYTNRVISIEHEWTKTTQNQNGELESETKYYDIYKVKIHEITLREIMILQAIYLCKTQNEIENIVRKQPNPKFFYKSFLEFDGANLLSMLSFDSGSVEALLHEDNEKYFDPLYPVIYKNKITKKSGKGEYLSSAIDNALRANQVKAVSLIIDYIIKFQNNYISSFLFLKNFPVLMEKGIEVTPLLSSNVFNVSFDYDDWPGSHPNDEKSIQPYNGSYFDIRLMYLQVFSDKDFDPAMTSQTKDKSQIYKIKYSVNLLGQCGMYCQLDEDGNKEILNEDVNLMSLCEESEEMEIFDTAAITDIIEYRWDHYAMNFHLIGLFMNIFYIFSIILYVKEGYISNSENQKTYLLVMNVGLVYPVCYEIIQLFKTGFFEYIDDNKVDVVYYIAGITNIVLQYMPEQGFGPRSITCKMLMCYLVCNLIIKTFFYLRIFESMTGIVVMLTNVISDLRAFMLFYIILLWLSSHMFMVVGLGNNLPALADVLAAEEAEGHRLLKASGQASSTGNTENSEQVEGADSPVEGTEYVHLGLYLGTVISTARISIGDFSAIDTSADLELMSDNVMFWIIWVFVMGATCIVFLNFIVAEASASYAVVMETLDQVIQQEKAALISEADGMSMTVSLEKYPKYLITREKDE